MCIFALTSSAVFYPTPKGSDGLRTKKTVNGTTTEYTYASGLLVSQSDPTTTLNFTYSADGIPRSVTYGESQYYYFYNLQGDVVAIYDSQGSTQVEYTYDTWGKLISVTGTMASTLGAKNPFRYRGYVYDTETGYYYLTTRYYDPETGRFLNADGYISTGEPLTGYNMFAYCCDNPVRYKDDTGNRRTDANNSLSNGKEADEIRIAYIHEQARVTNQEAGITSYVHRVNVNDTHTTYVCDSKSTAKQFFGYVGESFTVVVDERASNNFYIRSSHLIKDEDLRFAICSEIRNYHDLHPTTTEWDREIGAMVTEWGWHNFGHRFEVFFGIDVFKKNYEHVDLDMYPFANSECALFQMAGTIISHMG